jgi:hypothetical protein
LADGVQGRISINFLIASIALNTDVNWGKKCHIGNKTSLQPVEITHISHRSTNARLNNNISEAMA